jgi:ATP-dependent Clp protease ATP-binding subunit ClpA
MFERFTEPARAAVVEAQREARDLRHPFIGTEHLLLGVLAGPDTVGARALSRLGLGIGDARKEVIRMIGKGPPPALDENDARALPAIGIDLDRVRKSLEDAFGPGALERPIARRRKGWRRCMKPPRPGFAPLAPRAKKTLELALREARVLHHSYLGTEHVVLGIAREGDGVAARILQARGIDHDRLREAVTIELGQGGESSAEG